jgi:hypothetical protein
VVHGWKTNATAERLANVPGHWKLRRRQAAERTNNGPLPVAGVQCLHCDADWERLLTAMLGGTAAALREWRGSWARDVCAFPHKYTSAPACTVPCSAGAVKRSFFFNYGGWRRCWCRYIRQIQAHAKRCYNRSLQLRRPALLVLSAPFQTVGGTGRRSRCR